MRRAKYILCALALACTATLTGQSRSELREMFVSAEGDMLFEDYAEALPRYLNLLKIYPQNFNFYYRIGQCYLNTPGQKEESIPYLETAVQHIDPEYRKGKFNETGAPYDALYLLANAYRIHNDLDKALETYDRFLKEVDTEVYDTTLVRFQVQTCLNAREMMKRPVYVVEKNFGSPINGRFSEYNPVMSADENSLLFTRELQFYDAVFWSEKINGQWTEPVNLTPQLGVDQDYYTSSLSADGKTLLLYRIDTYDGNIYLSRLRGDTWSHVEKLNGNINTKYWESNATMTRDGKKLYFTSNRRESLGGLDIFVSERDSTGDWGPAVNLGPLINTGYNEETPFLANNDRTLFFSSRGHYNMGGYDIFRSDLDANGRWGVPVNLGYPVNTTDDDMFFLPLGAGNRGLMARFSDDGAGRMDIYSYQIWSDRNPRNFFVTGKAGIRSLLTGYLQPVWITAINNADNRQEVTVSTNPATGLFSLRLPQGSYNFTFSSDDAMPLSQNIEMPLTYKGDTVRINPVILESTDVAAFMKILADSVMKVSGPDPVSIDLLTERMSILDIDVIPPDSAVITEHHQLSDTTFTFSFMPQIGKSMIRFTLTDRFGNDTTAGVAVIRSDRVRRQIPLYREIISAPLPPSQPSARQVTDTVKAVADTLSAPPAPAGKETVTGIHNAKPCWLWWLLLPAALIIFFIIRKRKKKERNEKE
jgi:tetratricopeptide (TPR) repeat protein